MPDVAEDRLVLLNTELQVPDSPAEIGLDWCLERPTGRSFDQITEWVAADLAELAPSRHRLSDWLTIRLGAGHKRQEDIVLVFAELLANAIKASPAQDEIRYSYSSDCQGIKLRVVNQNNGEVPVLLGTMPEPDADEGRGLPLVHQFADRVELNTTGREVNLSVHFYL